MKLLLLGAHGQLGQALGRSLAPLGEVVALGRQPWQGLTGDLADPGALQRTVRAVAPDVIVNAAAYTAVDRAEQEPDLAWQVNARAPGLLAREMRASQGWLVHYSSDYVFDGQAGAPYAEDSPAAPLNQYGRSKLAGDEEVAASGARHLLLRTGWVYGLQGENFPRTVLRLAASQSGLRMVDDQVGTPTGADLIADVTAHALRRLTPGLSGLYHLAAQGEVSRLDYARHVIAQARALGRPLALREITAVSSASYPTPALRPLDTRLDCTRLQAVFGLRLPPWRDGIDRLLRQWCASPWAHAS